MLLRLIIVIIALKLHYIESKPDPTESYNNELILKEPDLYYLYWNYDDTDITFEVHVKTDGWIGFGISPTGGMENSDVIVAWINEDKSANFTDRYVDDNRNVIKDETQNWSPITVLYQDGYTLAKFSRKIKNCDDLDEDMNIVEGTPIVIFAWGESTPTDDISYHGESNRGSRAIPLISSLNLKVDLDMSEIETQEFRVETTIDSESRTEYFCQMFQLPDSWLTEKRHLIRYETLLTEGTEPNLHHWLLYECSKKFESEYLTTNSVPSPGYCFPLSESQSATEWMEASGYCKKVSLGWAVGGPYIQDFPNDMAYPLGGPDADFKYFYLQIHYDNPTLASGLNDNSGIKLYVTKNYRKTEFGVLTVGAVETWAGTIIPPEADIFTTDYFCRPDCLDNLYDNVNEITVIGSLPHTHLRGKEVYTKVIRDGKEVSYLANNKYYDFNYQYFNFLADPVVLQKGDSIKTTCVYTSQDYSYFTVGGPATTDEMCLDFIMYYPKINGFDECKEMYDSTKWTSFLTSLALTGEITIDSTTLKIETSNPSSNLIAKFQAFHDNTERVQVCQINGEYTLATHSSVESEPIDDDYCSGNQNNKKNFVLIILSLFIMKLFH